MESIASFLGFPYFIILGFVGLEIFELKQGHESEIAESMAKKYPLFGVSKAS